MALTKKMLQAMDIADDKVEQILEAHVESINGLTAKRDELQAELDKEKAEVKRLSDVEKELVKANAKIEESEKIEEKYKALQVEFNEFKADAEAKNTLANKEKAYKALLKAAGVAEKRFDSILRVTDFNNMDFDEAGNLKDADKLTENIKSEWSDFIITEGTQGANVPKPPMQNESGAAFDKMSLAEKMAYANENPENAEVKTWLNN